MVGLVLTFVAFTTEAGGWFIFVGFGYIVYVIIVFVIEMLLTGIYVHRLIVSTCSHHIWCTYMHTCSVLWNATYRAFILWHRNLHFNDSGKLQSIMCTAFCWLVVLGYRLRGIYYVGVYTITSFYSACVVIVVLGT